MSKSTQKSFFRVGPVGNGSLWIGPRPSEDNLLQWVIDAQSEGINHVVSLIEDEEVSRYKLQLEAAQLLTVNIGLTRFPVDDFDVPDGGSFRKLITSLTDRLQNGETLFLHCAGGVGRAGTTASCLLIEHGIPAESAMRFVSEARGVNVPETAEQAEFIRRWSRRSA